jgi:di/tricarboxylate transporter
VGDIWITFAIVLATVVLFIWNRVPVVIVAMGTALALYATGVLSLSQALAGLGDHAVIFIATLFIVSAGLEITGVTAWAGQLLIAGAGRSRTQLLMLTLLLVAMLTALISVNGAVAALLPVVIVASIRLNHMPSQLLMPMVFGAHAGSMLTLTGTPVNVLASEAVADLGLPPFGFFEFGIAGIPLLLGTMAIITLFGARLLPHCRGRTIPPDLSNHARTLVEHYRLEDGVFQLRVRAKSPFVGMPRGAISLKDYPGLSLVAVRSGQHGGPLSPQSATAEGDVLVLRGDAKAAAGLMTAKHLAIRSEDGPPELAETLFNRGSGLGEVMISPRSSMIDHAVFPGMVTPSGDLLILAVHRNGIDQGPGETVVRAGDTLLLQGTWKALDTHLDDPDVLVVDSPDLVRRQAVPMGAGAWWAVAVLVGMVVLLASGAVAPVVAGLLAVGAMLLPGIVTVDQAYRAVDWTTVILVGAMMPLSTAMQTTGAADLLAETLVGAVGGGGPYALIGGLFILTAVLGQLISNTATALIVIPIAVAAATEIGISPRPVLMSVAIAAAASFLTPVATPTNLMIMGPAGYQFGDYWKLGLPCLLWFFVMATFFVPIVWPA